MIAVSATEPVKPLLRMIDRVSGVKTSRVMVSVVGAGASEKSGVLDGVTVRRVNVALRIGKGPLMPGFLLAGWQLARQADVVHVHLPQLDAAGLAVIGRLLGKRLVATYHCDLQLPAGLLNRLANLAATWANHIAASLAQHIATNTRDYAEHSPFLRRYLAKVTQIYPPAVPHPPAQADCQAVSARAGLQPGQVVIGMAARLASEKGVEYLLEALPEVQKTYPQARVLFVGPYQNVPGEEAYAQRLAPLFARLGPAWSFLGVLANGEFAAFLSLCDLTVLPSLNSTESFGMVQIESMLCGVPVVAADLPGVRQPVRLTGMGRLVPAANAPALAQAILDLLAEQRQPGALARPARLSRPELEQIFSPDTIARQYESLFQESA